MDLMTRGMPREAIEANVERLRHGAREEGARELKLFFILQQISNEREVDVDEAELNGRIALLAVQRGRRPEKMKQEMAKDGSLAKLYDKWFMQPIPPTNTALNLPLSDATKAAWASPNNKPMEDYAKK